jgi:CheY-like chemotaxis protein
MAAFAAPAAIFCHVVRSGMTEAGPRKRILIADRSQPIREYLEALLEQMGFSVTLAATPEEVEPAFRTTCFDLVLIDFMDGAQEGVEIVMRLLLIDPGVPLVAMPKMNRGQVLPGSLEGLVAGVLWKPFNMETDDGLIALLDRFFERA